MEIKLNMPSRFPYCKELKLKANKFFYSENSKEMIFTSYLSGANSFINNSKKLLLLNGYDEIYTLFYFEYFDLSLRAWKMGWKMYYYHQSICYQKVSASTEVLNNNNFVKKVYYKNSFIFQAIHLEKFRSILWKIQLYTITLFFHILKGEFWIFKSLKQFIEKNV